MKRIFSLAIKIFLIFALVSFYSYKVYAEEEESTLQQLQILQKDIKTLEKAIYSKDVKTTFSSGGLSGEGSRFPLVISTSTNATAELINTNK